MRGLGKTGPGRWLDGGGWVGPDSPSHFPLSSFQLPFMQQTPLGQSTRSFVHSFSLGEITGSSRYGSTSSWLSPAREVSGACLNRE